MAGNEQIVAQLDQKCLGITAGAGGSALAEVTLHESTIAHVFVDGDFVGILNNEGHNGQDSTLSLVLPKRPSAGLHQMELLSSTLGVSADIASMSIALGTSIEYLGVGPVTFMGNASVSGEWSSQAGLFGEALQVFSDAGVSKVNWKPAHGVNVVSGLTWLKVAFDAPSDWASPEALAVDLTGATKGHLYINGFDCGRYWVRDKVLSTYYQLPPDNLKRSGNVLVLWEEIRIDDLDAIQVVRRINDTLTTQFV